MGSLHDAYELGGVAGHGRTTLVRLAVRRGDCLPVALKQLRMEHAIDPDKRGRFLRQYRSACMLQHDNIESLIDIVEGDDGPVAVSEWIDGRSLLRLAQGRRRDGVSWEPSEIVVIARSLLEALNYAHHHPTGFDAQGMLHGGIWPGNILLNSEGTIKLVDFGMAAVWQEAPEPWQDLEALRYLSADHVRHGPSASSDIFSVGGVVHELITGQRFRGECETESEMRAAIDRTTPPECDRDIPAALERLRKGLLEPIPNPRLTIEHMLDLCASIPAPEGPTRLRELVRTALRTDSTQPESDSTPPRGISIEAEPDGITRSRERTSAAAHAAASQGFPIKLEQVPLGRSPRSPRPRDTQSVPVPVQHEVTAAREPLFLDQTAPPKGAASRAAEERRSGVLGNQDEDTAPIENSRSRLRTELLGEKDDDAPQGVPQRISDAVFDPDATAEVNKIAQLPEDEAREQAATIVQAATTEEVSRSPLRGPLGWALLGALAVGLGLPLVARCSAQSDEAADPKVDAKRK